MDLKIDRDTGDLIFQNGACPITTDFTDSTAQRVFVMLRTFEDEWYLNASTGVPYIPRILGRKVQKEVVDRIIQEKILAEQGVADIISYTSFINNDRQYTASFKIRDTSGGIVDETYMVGDI